jgi:hypothetical protein
MATDRLSLHSSQDRTERKTLMTGTCPKDGAQLMEINRGGVLVDVCPECKGVWLDRGELEKIVSLTRELEAEYASLTPSREDRPRDHEVARPRDGYARPDHDRQERGSGLGGLLEQAKRALGDDRDDDRYDRRRDPRYSDPRYSRDSGEWEDDDRRKKKKSGLGRLLDIFD